MDKKEVLKSMLQNIINGKEEDAAVQMHDYFVTKTREVTGLASQETVVEPQAKETTQE